MLDKHCSACPSKEGIDIETVTNVAPRRGEMFPVMLCRKCKTSLVNGSLDVKMNAKGNLFFVFKKKTK